MIEGITLLQGYDALMLFLRQNRDILRNEGDVDDLLDEMSYSQVRDGVPVALDEHWWIDWMAAVRDVLAASKD